MKIVSFFSTTLILIATICYSQDKQTKSSDYLNKKWKDVATNMPSEWYGSEEGRLVAENVLICQKEIGGWEKNVAYHKKLSEQERQHFINDKTEIGGTFDNGATITELKFLAKVYSHFLDERYKKAFERGVNYIIIAQYENGGWPQFFPVKHANKKVLLDKIEPYSGHITYNDDAMVNTMKFLREIVSDTNEYASLQLNNELKMKAKKAFDKGIECILNTQIIVDGLPTVWCAQHDKITLAPANARSYELASYSGAESSEIVFLLMDIDDPSNEIITSVNGAVKWFEDHKIECIKIEKEIQTDGKKNKIVVEDKNAPTLWARFYDLESGKPFFCDRDGVKKNSLAEIGYNRRNGYSWYTNKPEEVLNRYNEWSLRIK